MEHRKENDGIPFQGGDIIKIIALVSGDYSKYFQFTYFFLNFSIFGLMFFAYFDNAAHGVQLR